MATKFIESGTDATQDLTFYSSTSGTVTSATDQSHTGPRALKGFTSSPAVAALINRSGVLADTGIRISFWIRFDTWTGSPDIFRAAQSGGSSVFTVGRNASGSLSIFPQGATTATGTKVLVTDTWYRIGISYYITNTTTYKIKLYLNGLLIATASAGTLTRTTTDTLIFVTGTGLGINASVWFDDVYIDDGASSSSQPDIGNILVTAKRPNANGTTNNFNVQIGAGGSGYGTGHSPQVNEQPLSTTNGWSVVAVAATTEEYNIENATTGDVDISTRTIFDYAGWVVASSVTSETAQIIVNNATSNISLTSTATFFIAAAGSTTYPPGTGTDIGIVTDATATTVGLYECGILIAYIVSGPLMNLPLLGVG